MLEEWDKQDFWSKEELMVYAHELWKTVEEFENELKHSTTFYDIQIKKLKFANSTRVEWIKNKTNNYILALEEAILITKDKCSQEIENLNMRLSEFESKMMNQQVKEPELTNILTKEWNKMDDIHECQLLIHKLQVAGKGLK